jgi:hypothetical protein
MWRTIRISAYALVATLALSGFALAQRDRDYDNDGDEDGYYRGGNFDQARQSGYQGGYNDGIGKGRHEGREHDPYDYQTPDWRQATRGYQRWMGPVEVYQRAYREGYSNGFRSGYQETAQGWRDGDRYGNWRNDGWRTGYDPDWENVANRYGYQDGAQAAREDIEHRKSYNSKPRGRFDDRDHGYRREFGSKDQYKAEYTAGYRAGYDAVMQRSY